MRNAWVVLAFGLAACGTEGAGSATDAGTDAVQACTGSEPEAPAGQPICTQGTCTRVGAQTCMAQGALEYDCPKGDIVTLPGSCDAPIVSGSLQIYCCH